MVQTRSRIVVGASEKRRGRNERAEEEEEEASTTRRTTRSRRDKEEVIVEKEKTPIKKSESAIKKAISPAKKTSPIKKMLLFASPGRTTFSRSRGGGGAKKEEEERVVLKMEEDEDALHAITTDMNKIGLEMCDASSSQDSAISSCGSLSKSLSPLSFPSESDRDEEMTPPPSECIEGSASSSSLLTPIVPLRGREKEFEKLIALVDASVHQKDPLTVYISGTPGTGKSATTRLVLQLLEQAPRKIKTCMVNCTSVRSGEDLCAAIMKNVDKPCTGTQALAKFKAFVTALKKTFVLVLDEADFVSEKALTSIFTMPAAISAHLIVIGIANTIDFTERVLRKIKLKKEPVLMVFGRYSKQALTLILSQKMRDEREAEDEGLDDTALALCAGKVAAVSGDLRMAMDLMRQSSKKVVREMRRVKEDDEKKEKERMEEEEGKPVNAVPSTPVAVPSTPISSRETALRAINDVYRTVYSSPLARARLPLQPRVLLAVCLKLSAGKKKSLTRGALFNAYQRACTLTGWPRADGEDLDAAFDLLTSQSFVSIQGDQIRMQVDTVTARSAIFDNELLRKIDDLKL